MQDCTIMLEIKDGTINLKAEQATNEAIALLSGWLQATLALKTLREGMDLDDVKDANLDIYLAAMELAEQKLRAENKEEQ